MGRSARHQARMKQGIGRGYTAAGSLFHLWMASAMYNRPRRSRQDLSALGEYLLSTPERLAVALANSTSEFLIVLDESGGVRYANPAFSRAILGGQAADGQNLFALVDEASAERGRETLAATLSSVNGERHQVELFHRCANRPGPIFYTFSKISAESGGALRLDGAESGGALRLDGDEAGVAAVGHDKTADLEFLGEIVQLNMQLEEKQTELADANVRLEQLAITDEITGLYNRHYF